MDVEAQAHPGAVVRKSPEADRLLSEGSELPEVLKHLEIAEATYHRWRNQYGGMKRGLSDQLCLVRVINQGGCCPPV